MAVKVVVFWITKDREAIAAIRKHFGLPNYTTLNGQTPGAIEEADMPMFDETARRGFLAYKETEWTFNGSTYSWQKWWQNGVHSVCKTCFGGLTLQV